MLSHRVPVGQLAFMPEERYGTPCWLVTYPISTSNTWLARFFLFSTYLVAYVPAYLAYMSRINQMRIHLGYLSSA